jgi:hypothetical protein
VPDGEQHASVGLHEEVAAQRRLTERVWDRGVHREGILVGPRVDREVICSIAL